MADAIRPGESPYLPGSAGEPTALLAALADRPDRTRNLRILSSAVPGINRLPMDALGPGAAVTGLSCSRACGRRNWVLLPLTFGMPPVAAILMLAGVYYGAQHGGRSARSC